MSGNDRVRRARSASRIVGTIALHTCPPPDNFLGAGGAARPGRRDRSVRHNCPLDDMWATRAVHADEQQEIHRFLSAGEWFGGLPAALQELILSRSAVRKYAK